MYPVPLVQLCQPLPREVNEGRPREPSATRSQCSCLGWSASLQASHSSRPFRPHSSEPSLSSVMRWCTSASSPVSTSMCEATGPSEPSAHSTANQGEPPRGQAPRHSPCTAYRNTSRNTPSVPRRTRTCSGCPVTASTSSRLTGSGLYSNAV